jgi:hypothetical protein
LRLVVIRMDEAPAALRYAARVPLLACPFCREMFEKSERGACPVCGVALVAFEKLPPSEDALNEDGAPREPEYEPLPATYFGRGRGPLAVVAALGLVAFALPWVHLTMPDVVDYSGLELSRRLGWVWGAGVAWFVLAPTVLSRRSIMQMRGARVAACFLGAIPGVTAGILLARPPHAHGIPVRFAFQAGLYATIGLSLAAFVLGLLFGGRLDDIRVERGTSRGQVVH